MFLVFSFSFFAKHEYRFLMHTISVYLKACLAQVDGKEDNF